MVCQYEKHRIASNARMAQVIGCTAPSPAAPTAASTVSIASGP